METNKLNDAIPNKKTKFTSETNNNQPGPSRTTQTCCVSSFLTRSEAIMDSTDPEPPLTLVPGENPQDYNLRRWQARQLARGFVDNTINALIEGMGGRPPPEAVDLVDNLEHLESVRDEGILMAIELHGLRRAPLFRETEMRDVGVEGESDFLNAAVMAAIDNKGLAQA